MTWGALGGAAIGVVGGAINANSNKKAAQAGSTQTTQNQMDPRVGGILFGGGSEGDPPGLLNQYMSHLNAPQDGNLATYGAGNLNYLNNFGADSDAQRLAAQKLMGGNAAPMTGPAAWAQGNMIDAPKQNNLDLSGSYNKFINGDPGANPYLTGAIQGGIGQSEQSMRRMQDDSTRNLMENILPSLRSNTVLNGQFGGSRGALMEGRAIGDFGREQQRTMENFGNNNTTAAVGAQAGAFDRGQDRALAATQGLSGQQYGVAAQNAATKNQAEFMNVGNVQQSQLANQQAQLQTNQQNNSAALAGAGLLSGQMNNAYNVGTNQANYGLNQAQQVNGLLAPYLGQVPGSSVTTGSQPMYGSTAGSMLGGAAAGIGLYNQFNQAQGGNTPQTGPGTGANAGMWYNGHSWVPIGT